MMTQRYHCRTVSWSWTSLVICAACPGVNDWGMASCHLCRPPAALPPWRLSSGPNAQAETPLPAWTPSPWSGTMTMTSAEGWRAPAGPWESSRVRRESSSRGLLQPCQVRFNTHNVPDKMFWLMTFFLRRVNQYQEKKLSNIVLEIQTSGNIAVRLKRYFSSSTCCVIMTQPSCVYMSITLDATTCSVLSLNSWPF